MFDAERKQQIVANCQALIRDKSYSGEEAQVVKTISGIMKNYGFDTVDIDRYGNVIGGIIGQYPGKTIVFDGHIDTVPYKQEYWTKDPLGADIDDGKIYGRGTSDMKGSVSAMLSAAGFFAQDKKRSFSGKIYIACTVHEECFEGIAARLVSEKYKPDYVVIGECSELNLKIGQRGRAEIVVETFGKPAHSANPEAGINAVYKMAELIGRIRTIEPTISKVLGKGILELTDIKSSPYPGASVVPDYCRATFDRRLLVGETKESVLAPLQEILNKMKKDDPQFLGKISYAVGREQCYTGNSISGERFFPGWSFDESDAFIKMAREGLHHAGLDPKIQQYSFCTNGSHYAGEAGIPTVGFGPSRENLAHTIDEYIEIEQLINATKGFYGIMDSVCRNSAK